MVDLFALGDELGPAKIIHVQEPSIGLKGILVVDNVAAGPSIGGLRMAPDVDLDECRRLARAMTLKNAAASLAHGGGKAVLVGDPKMPLQQKQQLIRGFANALRDIREYIFGPDMGTDEECMAWVQDEIGRSVGLPLEVGGIPLDKIGATGWGLSHVTDVALGYCDFELKGATFAVQGFGAVGKHVARYLSQKGAILVAAADSAGTLYDPTGLNVAALIELKDRGGRLHDHPNGEKSERDAIIDVACDIWIPAARPDVINEENVDRLNTKLVIEGANIPITHGAESRLTQRGILYVPDFIANAGGVICAAMEYQQSSQSAAFAAIEEKLRQNTHEVLQRVKRDQIEPRQAALELAEQRVRTAMSLRRWSIF